MLHQITLSALAVMDQESRMRELGSLVDATKTANGSATAYLEGRIRSFEERFKMSSQEMLERLRSGQQEETAEIASWLFYLDALKAHGR